MQTEQEIRDGYADCKKEILDNTIKLSEAIASDNDEEIANTASYLGMLGNVLLTISEILK